MIGRRRIAFKLAGPVLSRSTAIGAFGVDTPAARRSGTLYLPGTLVLGRIKDAFRILAQVDADYAAALALWFGAMDDTKTGAPRRRRLFISDLTFQTVGASATRPRVAIDPLSGAVLEGAIQIVESPFAIGETVTCEGDVRLLGQAREIEAFWPLLLKAMSWITQLGSLRTVGYGRIKRPSLLSEADPQPPEPPAACDRLRIVLDVRDPLCVGEKRNDRNTYASSDVIPGGAIKGTLAAMILADIGAQHSDGTVEQADKSVLGRNFSRLRFTHAVPVPRTADGLPPRPSRIPHSWVRAPACDAAGQPLDHDIFYDAARAAKPEAAHTVGGIAPRFSPDWKRDAWTAAEKLIGWSAPDTELRVRTAIDETLRSAKANQLFAIECVVTTGHLWVGEIDLSAIPDDERVAVARALNGHVAHGIIGLGRTGSFALVGLEPAAEHPEPATDEHGRVSLVLQSAALLRQPAPSGDVTEAYGQAFRALGADSAGLTLAAIFVRERLAGAGFMATRFFRDGRTYQPYLLTEPGSTFVFNVETGRRADALARIAGWERSGLDIPAPTRDAYGLPDDASLWQVCPYVRENGYAEVASRTRLTADTLKPLGGIGIEPLPPEPGAEGGQP
nr:RAMP superfamily CRISPR-associated protein [uncultured Rhodopila sp.]